MLLTPILFILFIMISPSLAFDGSIGEESARHLDGIRGFLYNIPRRSSKVASACFCEFQMLCNKSHAY